MDERKQTMLELLKANKGFFEPERWIDYAIQHNFQRIEAEKLGKCPDCGAPSFTPLGQYVYYSTLITLQACCRCGLVFSDTRIGSEVIKSHFENTYKDEDYFLFRRYRIFNQVFRLVDSSAPQGGSVLDVGGAKGHLMAIIKQRRPDLTLILNDISKSACDWPASKYGLDTVCGNAKELEKISRQFDIVIMSDVIYYEPELNRLWKLLPRLVSIGGTVIIRVPNKLRLIRIWEFIRRFSVFVKKRRMQGHIRFFNSEHLYVFSQRYLLNRLKKLGFSDAIIMPSELLLRERMGFLSALYYCIAQVLFMFSSGKLVITPSFLVIARNKNGYREGK